MIGLIKTLFIFGAIYFVSRILSTLLGGGNRNSGRSFNRQQGYQKPRPEGDINVDYIPKKEKKFGKDKGEYVDYEEIKD